MKLLIVTQTLDVNDPVLGFFVRWVEEFAKHCEHVHALSLNVGEYTLPENVTVHCLGKSEGKSKPVWLWRLWKLSWQLRHEYDATFVHMNPEFVFYGIPVWKFSNKKIGMWYAHGAVTYKLKFATQLLDVVFTSTKKGYRINSSKCKIIGQAIDTELFAPHSTPKDNTVLRMVSTGRISPSKNLKLLITTCKILAQQNVPVKLSLIGGPKTTEESFYNAELVAQIAELGLQNQVRLVGPVPHNELPELINQHDLYISAGKTGSLDKALLEAVSCGIITLSSNEAYRDFAGNFDDSLAYSENSVKDLVNLLMKYKLNPDKYQTISEELRSKVISEHSLDKFIPKVISHYENL